MTIFTIGYEGLDIDTFMSQLTEHGIDTVHIVSHGESGRLWLGNGLVDERTITRVERCS